MREGTGYRRQGDKVSVHQPRSQSHTQLFVASSTVKRLTVLQAMGVGLGTRLSVHHALCSTNTSTHELRRLLNSVTGPAQIL